MPAERPAPPPISSGSRPSSQADSLPPRERRPAWFWIAIVGGCFAVIIPIVIIAAAAIALPSLLRVNKAANQISAIQTLRTISSAESSYSTTYPGEGFACSLRSLGGNPESEHPNPQSALLIDPALASNGYKSGYIFSVVNCGSKTVGNRTTFTEYRIAAIPQSLGKTGDVGYCINENNVITVDPTGKWDCTQPLQ
jgi:type IV pilus assembly protein PilA